MPFDRRTLLGGGLGAGLGAAALAGAARAQPAAVPVVDPTELRIHTDWAFLRYYKAENAADRVLPANRRRVVFLGDSITAGWREFHPAFFTDNGFLCRGISGQTTPQMLVRFWPDVAAMQPALVHIMAGTNDVAENTGPFDPQAVKDNIQAMCALARASRMRVVLAAIPPAADFPWRRGLDPAAKIPLLNAWLKDYAAHQGFGFADYTAVLDDGAAGMIKALAYDGVHPTREGYAAMEPVALRTIAAVLAKA